MIRRSLDLHWRKTKKVQNIFSRKIRQKLFQKKVKNTQKSITSFESSA